MMSDLQNNRQAVPPSMGDTELYEQIAAGDEQAVHTARHNSLGMSVMVWYMRWTLALDAKRREYQNVFRLLGHIWTVFMTFLYLCGIVMFVILVVSYMRFQQYVEDYLRRNGIEYRDVQIPGYVISKIELYDLHDKQNTYHIDRVVIFSTFSDFLNQRVKSVSLEGVRLTIEEHSKEKSSAFLSVLTQLNDSAKSEKGLRIDSLDISRASLSVKGKNYELPISFSLAGVYGRETKVAANISIREPYLTMTGRLVIQDDERGASWDLDIQNGTVSFPGRPQETLTGKASLKSRRGAIQEVSADIALTYDQIQKWFSWQFNRVQERFDGKVQMRWVDVSGKPDDKVNMELGLKNVQFESDGTMKTDAPIQVTVNKAYFNGFKLDDLTAQLTGTLLCHLPETCTYDLTRPTEVNARLMRLSAQGQNIENRNRFSVTVVPQVGLVTLQPRQGNLLFTLPIEKVDFAGRFSASKDNLAMQAKRLILNGQYGILSKTIKMGLQADDLTYRTAMQVIEHGTLIADDLFRSGARVVLKSPMVHLNNVSSLKVPFSLEYTQENNRDSIFMSLLPQGPQILFTGYFDTIGGQIDGQIVVPTFDLEKLPQPLNRVSGLISPTLKQVSGQMSVYGRLYGNVRTSLNGPLYMALSDMNVKTDDLTVKNLNTALTFRTLRPLLTDVGQRVYVGRVESFIPLENIDMSFQMEENFVRLSRLVATLAGVPVQGEETLIPYKNVGTLVYLKNASVNLMNVSETIFPKNWKMKGALQGSVLLPIEIKNASFGVKNATISLVNTALEYIGNPKAKPKFMKKDQQLDITSGTIVIDGEDGTDVDRAKINLTLNVLTEPSKFRHVVRTVLTDKISDLIRFVGQNKTTVPPEISVLVRYIQQQTETFRVK